MNNFIIKKENYDMYIFKGALALESYYDNENSNQELYDLFNKELKEYRELSEKNDEIKEKIVNRLFETLEKLGIEKFIIYDDGDIEYRYNEIEEGANNNVR